MLQEQDQVSPLFISTVYQNNHVIPLYWNTFQSRSDYLNTVVVFGDLNIFRIVHPEDQAKEIPYRSFIIDLTQFTIVRVSNRVQFNTTEMYNYQEGVSLWDDQQPSLDNLISLQQGDETFPDGRNFIPGFLIFIKKDYTNAIVQLNQWLSINGMKATPNPDQWPDIQQPLACYLLGLAYELSGNSEKAVQVYWELWRDYPNHFYGMIAAEKVQLK